jgi:NAD(P)H-dependent FMN reductase
MSKLRLQVVIASTRPGRLGLPIGNWVYEQAKSSSEFDVELVDLVDYNLPLLDEPRPASSRQYANEHTLQWSQVVSRADAFVFVTPEYNHGINAAFKNALDYLYYEWALKPATFVSYGGMSAGMRAVQQAKQVLAALRVYPLTDAVPIPNVASRIDDDGKFRSDSKLDAGLGKALTELHRVAGGLLPLRSPNQG